MLAAVRREWRRGFALALALWFAALSVDFPTLHTCPTHGADVTAPAAHGGHSHDSPAHSATCSCLGQCCVSTPTTLPTATLHATIAGAIVEGTASALARFDAPSTWSGFALPFATAPPLG